MAWSIELSSGGTSVTIETEAKFRFDNVEKRTTENGKVESTDVLFTVEGDVVDPAATPDVYTATRELYDLVVEHHQPATVTIYEDDEERWSFTPANCFGSPHVIRFRTIGADGDGLSRWRYELQVYARVKGNQFGGVYELSSSVLTRKEYGKIVRKVWRATAKASSASSALSTVNRFKPGIPSDDLSAEEIEQYAQEARASGLWVWDARKTQKVLHYDEPICYMVEPSVKYMAEELPGDEEPPLAIKGRMAVGVGRVEGIVYGLSKNVLKAPAPHWTHNATTIIRRRDLEKRHFAAYDPKTRIWGMRYEEVWDFYGPKPPDPKHADHNDGTITLPPADGLAGSL